eukprot:gnl/TRDRNA2_/TRDRNA2_169903_c0_seq4.p1 gnl/TRDRNA2_/TRDRNA2_169903_c0~~gnl/TRDRNA2_/TRDRNA2_169903_c0_seq4.p1  ORF type:complete len:146 (-),score=11.60 gnl/TRDRNA2_/TRDRNA2_169903_c0_seq4:30-467(-)
MCAGIHREWGGVGIWIYAGRLAWRYLRSGEAIDGLRAVGKCCDGGGVTHFPGRSEPLLYYHTFYDYVASCSLKSIEFLFRQGVDETIRTLTSKNLRTASLNGQGGMAIASSGDARELAALKSSFGPWAMAAIRAKGNFVDAAIGS